jgi:hypothetical protein
MELEILCTPDFTNEESAAIDRAAALLHLTREEVVRSAVKFFCTECVPTHSKTSAAA